MAAVITPGGHNRVPRRVLQYNVHASARFRTHEIRLETEDKDVSIEQWLSAIQPEDAIQIIPKAQYPAWINYTREASIEIHGSLATLHTQVANVPRLVELQDTAASNAKFCY
jgi:hypothetical protein